MQNGAHGEGVVALEEEPRRVRYYGSTPTSHNRHTLIDRDETDTTTSSGARTSRRRARSVACRLIGAFVVPMSATHPTRVYIRTV